MHTTKVKDERGKEYYIFHNGDWSGMADVRPVDSKYVDGAWTGEVTLPGFVLRNACKAALAREMASRVNDAVVETLEQIEKGF